MRSRSCGRSSRVLYSLAILLSFAFVASGAESGFEELRSLRVGDKGRVTVRTDLGALEVRGGAPGMVRVEMSRPGSGSKADFQKSLKFSFTQEGDEVRFEVHLKPDVPPRAALQAIYRITIPTRFEADIETSGGDISVQDVAGRVRVKTSGANLSLAHLDGPLEATTSGGNISLEEPQGGAAVSTSGGWIMARFSKDPRKDIQLSTYGGNLKIYLAPDVSVDLDATAHGGSVSAGSRLRQSLRGNEERSELYGEINGGGSKVVLRTYGGNIAVEEGH